MTFCAIICEFNPFHNGHKYLLEQAKKLSGCDFVLCIMSGSFTQRGEICIMDKHTRARHAIMNGADCVIELPVSFTVAPAEIFAKGAVKILNAIPNVAALAFGCEDENSDFFGISKKIISESADFKKILRRNLESGQSYIKSFAAAFTACGGNGEAISKPNNILGIEYSKAAIKCGARFKIIPIRRVGSGFNDGMLKENFSSAAAIREDPLNPDVKNNVPAAVCADLRDFSAEKARFEELMRFKLLCTPPKTLKRIIGCTEGLENNLKSRVGLPYGELISAVGGKRYSCSRIKRILLANLLDLYEDECKEFLKSPLYLKPLAVKKQRSDEILSALSQAEFPLLLKKKNIGLLKETAEKCLEKDLNAGKIRDFIFNLPVRDFDYPKFI